jgi:hypothetical protein
VVGILVETDSISATVWPVKVPSLRRQLDSSTVPDSADVTPLTAMVDPVRPESA